MSQYLDELLNEIKNNPRDTSLGTKGFKENYEAMQLDSELDRNSYTIEQFMEFLSTEGFLLPNGKILAYDDSSSWSEINFHFFDSKLRYDDVGMILNDEDDLDLLDSFCEMYYNILFDINKDLGGARLSAYSYYADDLDVTFGSEPTDEQVETIREGINNLDFGINQNHCEFRINSQRYTANEFLSEFSDTIMLEFINNYELV